jgi:hypothetical protein
MNGEESVLFMRQTGKKVVDKFDAMYQLCHHEKIMVLMQDTSCAALIDEIMDIDSFLEYTKYVQAKLKPYEC